jgi:hypothetical protein
MKIALFGDSFGETSNNKVPHWFDIVCQRLNWQATNFSKNGTHLYYSYNKFLEHQSDYDKIIIIASHPGRYPTLIKIGEETFSAHSFAGIDHLEKHKRDTLTIEEARMLRDIKSWYMVQNMDYAKTVQNLFLADILNKRNDVILIPAFMESMNDDILKKVGLTINDNLNNIKESQIRMLGYTSELPVYVNYSNNYDLLSGHFTEEVNQKFAELVYERLVSGVWKSFDIGFVNHKLPFEEYYIPNHRLKVHHEQTAIQPKN